MIRNRIDLKKYLHEDLLSIYYTHKIFPPQSLLAYLLCYPYAFLWQYLKNLRYAEYYFNVRPFAWKLRYFFHSYRMRVEASKLGCLEIPINTLGYGTKFPHIGKIIINKDAKIGNYCTIYPGVCIGKKGDGDVPLIGDRVYLGLGSKILGKVHIYVALLLLMQL